MQKPCSGRIVSAELVDKPREKKKKGAAGTQQGQHAQQGTGARGAQVPAAGAAGRSNGAVAAPAAGGGRRPAGGAGVPMSLAKAEEFLGIAHEGESIFGWG